MRERLKDRFVRCVEKQGAYYERERLWEEAVECFRKGLEVDDLAEIFYQRLMYCYQRLDRFIGNGGDVSLPPEWKRRVDTPTPLIHFLTPSPVTSQFQSEKSTIYRSIFFGRLDRPPLKKNHFFRNM
jgi:hypothetical protein